MRTAVVTGAGGFVGSHLVEALLGDGWRVRGIDAFTDYYEPARKHANLAVASADSAFELVEADLADAELGPLVEGADAVFHQAAQPGVRASWADGFETYARDNVVATQRLLEACKRVGTPRLVYASSSSVYGRAVQFPSTEDDRPEPHSPYGVTKLAGEHLCRLYAWNHGLSTVSLRYFTVFGPRQRPDMAMHRLFAACLGGPPFPVYGDGSAIRDFTFVADVVAANLAAAAADVGPGAVYNVAGGGQVTLREVWEMVGEIVGRPVPLDVREGQPGDVSRTAGSTELIHRELGWEPTVSVRAGLEAQHEWQRALGTGPDA